MAPVREGIHSGFLGLIIGCAERGGEGRRHVPRLCGISVSYFDIG
jgi:hypothetical protein